MCHQIFLKEYFEIFSIIFSLRSHKACQKHVLYKFDTVLLFSCLERVLNPNGKRSYDDLRSKH